MVFFYFEFGVNIMIFNVLCNVLLVGVLFVFIVGCVFMGDGFVVEKW